MCAIRIRPYREPADADRQYELWLRATAGLPYAWRSNRTNARHITRVAEEFPEARLYAEDSSGRLVGYIGTHPPVDWEPGLSLIPFGFPWTDPQDPDLERDLYERMLAATPKLYPDHARAAGYVQRFRASWHHQISFLMERGWRERWRYPLLALPCGEPTEPEPPLVRVTDDDLPAVVALASNDPHLGEPMDVDSLRRRFDGGWLEQQSLWLVPQVGAFELEVRGRWGEVRLLVADPRPAAFETVCGALRAVACRQGATELYVTVEDGETGRRQQLEQHGFRVVDAGVYLMLDL